MRYEKFIERVQEFTGLETGRQARRVSEVTCSILGELLVNGERAEIASHLPEPLGEAVQSGEPGQAFGLEAFYERVSESEGVERSFGMEHAQVVCQVLGEALGDDGRTFLQRRLPDDFTPLFEPREISAPSPYPDRVPSGPEPGRTLATGRPGSSRPLSESQVSSGQQNSVATSKNPHGDTKLSSGKGPLNEEETLASGSPGSQRPLSDYEGED